MTEKQGGSDVRPAPARPYPTATAATRLTGHKWFTSAAMSDVFLVLAQAPGGLSCFFLPRVLPDGSRNRMFIQRLEEQARQPRQRLQRDRVRRGDGVAGRRGGPRVPTIIEMVNMTRLDCTLGSATSMRRARDHGHHHVQHRKAFGAYLIDQPLMRNVIADLPSRPRPPPSSRCGWPARRRRRPRRRAREPCCAGSAWPPRSTGSASVPPHAAEAMECLGGNGYAEESRMPRLYREAPLMGIWEGSRQRQRAGHAARHGNPAGVRRGVVRRAVDHRRRGRPVGRPRAGPAVQPVRSADPGYRARKVAEDISLALQGSLLGSARSPRGHRCVPGQPDGRRLGWRLRHPADRTGPRPDHRALTGQGDEHPPGASFRASRREIARKRTDECEFVSARGDKAARGPAWT